MGSFGTPYVKQFTSTSDPDINVYDSSGSPGATTDTGGSAHVLQAPRLKQNVTIVTDATAPAPTGYSTNSKLIRVYSRAAPAAEGRTTAGWWSNGGFALGPGRQIYGRYTFSLRLSPGKNTKMVWLLWNVTGGWTGSDPGTGNEEDVIETFWQNGGTTDKGVGASNLHFRAADGTTSPSYQLHLPLGVSDWTTWHTCVFTWLPTSLNLTIDGVTAPGYPVTNPKYIPTNKMYVALQTAELVDPGSTRAGTSRTTGYADMSYVVIEPWSSGGVNNPPSVPQNLTVNALSTTQFKATYNASTDQETSVASYQIQYRTSDVGSGAGSWVSVTAVNALSQTITTPGPASTSYDFQVRATDTQSLSSDWSTTVTQSTLGSGTLPNAALSITPGTGYAPLTVTVSTAGTTGSPTSGTLDMGDGNPNNGGVPYNWGSLPTTYTYPSVGQYTATLIVTNASGTDQALAVVNVQDPTNNQNTTPNLGLTLIKSGDSGRSLRAPYNANMQAIDAAAGALGGIRVNGSSSDIVVGGQVAGESYARWYITTDGNVYGGDGTFEPNTNAPVYSFSGTAPSTTTTFSAAVSNNCGTSGSSSVTVVMPNTIATGSLAVMAVEVHAATSISTPTGWTQITSSPVDNSNGNDRLAVFYKAVSGTDAGTTITSTLGASNLWCAAISVYNNGTGVNVTAIAANAGTAQTNHPSPSVTTTNANEMVIGIVAGRFSTTSGKVITAPTGTNQRVQDNSNSTSTSNVSVVMFDYTQTAAGATSVGNATTVSGMFSNAATVALTHA